MSSFEPRCEHGDARARRRGTGELCWYHGAGIVVCGCCNCRPHCGIPLQRPLQITQPVQKSRPLLISLQFPILQVFTFLLPLTFPVSVPLLLPLQVQVGTWGPQKAQVNCSCPCPIVLLSPQKPQPVTILQKPLALQVQVQVQVILPWEAATLQVPEPHPTVSHKCGNYQMYPCC